MSSENVHEPFSVIFSHLVLVVVLLFGCFIIGLLCYIWAFISQRDKLPAFKEFFILSCRRRTRELHGTQRIYHAAFSLVAFDVFTIIFGLVSGILILCDVVDWVSDVCLSIWLAFRYLSQCQHLITAFISILFAYRPTWRDGLVDASKGLNAVSVLLIILSIRINGSILIGIDVYNFLLVVAIVVSWCLSSSSPIASERTKFGVMSLVFYLLVCLPTAVVNCLMTHSDDYFKPAAEILLITNFYIFMSADLFCMVLKLEDAIRNDTKQNESLIDSPVGSSVENPIAPVKALPRFKKIISLALNFLLDSFSNWFLRRRDKKMPCGPEKTIETIT